MSAVPAPTEEEKYLIAIFDDPSGIELAEFCWVDEEQQDGCFRAWDFQWCLSGDTVIYTSEGRKTLAECERLGKVTLLTGGEGDRGTWVDAAVRYFGQGEMHEIHLTRRGVRRVVKATREHRWFAGSGRADRRRYVEKMTGELAPGDFLQPMASPTQDFSLHREWVQRGIVAGDGTTVRGMKSLVRLYGEKRALESWFDVPSRPYHGNESITGVPAVEVSGLPYEYKTDIPSLTSPVEQRWGWLAGYFATDGSVALDGTCSIDSTSPRLMFAVRDICTSLGIVCSAVGHYRSESGYGGPSTFMRVVLRVSDLPEGFFLRQSHLLRKALRGAGKRAVDAWMVERVVPSGVEDIYCAEVPGTHSFVLDGDILTGNSWYRNEDTYQIDYAGRSLGKSLGIQMRSFVFPFCHPGQEMLITAPELNHLRPVTDKVEHQILSHRLSRELLPKQRGNGINHQPQFQAHFINNARIMSRLPQRDGKGVKGQHPLVIEADEMQDFPDNGWVELIETMKHGTPGAQWRVHGVSRGVRDRYYRYTLGLDPDLPFRVHRYMAMHRPTWSEDERRQKIAIYGGTEDNVDYRRNIYGEHGDATNPVFVLARLMGCFVPGTLVTTPTSNSGFTPIEEIRAGDVVGNASGTGVVTKWHESWRDSIVEVEFDDGEVIRCTPEHPFATSAGWQNADLLRVGEEVWTWNGVVRGMRGDDPRFPQVLRQELCREMAGEDVPRVGHREADVLNLRVLPGDVLPPIEGGSVLLSPLCQQESPDEGATDRAEAMRGVPAGVCATQERSEVLFGVMQGEVGELDQARAGEGEAGGDWWLGSGALPSLERIGRGLAPGVLGITAGGIAGSGELSTRLSPPRVQDVRGGGRPVSPGEAKDGSGCRAGRLVGSARVVRVEVLRPGDSRFDGLSGGADQVRVIDLTVSGHPSFAVGRSGLLVHNCVRINESPWATTYNEEIYAQIKINDELLRRSGTPVQQFLDMPYSHLSNEYTSYWGGMDVGFTRDPSELLIFGETAQKGGESLLRLLTRIHLMRISASDQADIVRQVFDFYGERLRCVALDKTGNGLPLWQELDPEAVGTSVHLRRTPEHIAARVKGYGFSTKVPVEFDDRDLVGRERPEDAVIERNVVDFATDELRKLVDARPPRIELPHDAEILTEWQGQEVQYVRDEGSAAGVKRRYGGGSFHSLDAAKMMIAGRNLQKIEQILKAPRRQRPTLDRFGV